MTDRLAALIGIAALAWAATATLAAEGVNPDPKFVARSTRTALCEVLAQWSLQTGQRYCYSAYLPDGPVLADEPGQEVSIAAELAKLGWRMVLTRGVVAIVRDGDEAKVAALRKTLLESPDESAKRAAAYALGRLTVPAAVAALAEGLADKSPAVQFQCLEALWAIESDWDMRALPGRVSMLKEAGIKAEPLAAVAASAADDKPRRAWRYSVSLLGRAESPLVRALALDGLKDADPRVRLIAARALRHTAAATDTETIAKFVPEAFDREIVGRHDLASLAAMFRQEGPEVATLAADALGRAPAAQGEQALAEVLAAKEDWRRAAAADGLAVPAKSRPVKAIQALVTLCKDTSPLARAAAIRALAVVGGEEACKAVLDSSKDENAQVRLAAARALRQTGGAAALAWLNKLAADPNDEVKAEALHGLGWLGGVTEAEKLAAIAKDRSLGRDGPDAALVGLGDLLPPAARDIAVRTLLELMADPETCPYAVGRAAVALNDPRLLPGLLTVQSRQRGVGSLLRVDCMDAIGQLGSKESTEALAKNWWEYDNMPRYEGGRALRENLTRGVVHDTLLGLLKSEGVTQTAAAFSLSNSRDPRAVDALIDLLRSGKGDTTGAGIALGIISDPAATDALLAAATDKTNAARFVAARALRMRDLAWQPKVKAALVELYGWQADGTPPPIEQQKPGSWMLRRFIRDYDDMSVSELTYESAAAYDSRRGRMVQWGAHGKRYDSPQTGETWVYDPAVNTWTEKGLRELPPGTCMTREICYDSTNDRLIVRGGSGGGHGWLFVREQRLRNSNPWAYDPENDRWIPMRPAPLPGFAQTPLIEHDPAHGVVVALGRVPVPPPTTRPAAGQPKPPPPPAKPVIVATYDTYRNEWSRPATQPEAPTANFTAIAYDSRRGRMLFAGDGVLWAYNLGENKWTDLKPGGAAPKGASLLVYDSANDVALTFRAGRSGTTVFAYDPAANEWTQHDAAGMVPDHHNWDAVFDERHNLVIVCGGEVTECPGSPNARETWTYRFGPGKGEKPAVAAPAKAEIARTQPPIPIGVVATWSAGEKVRVSWEQVRGGDVAGYNVYRAAVTVGPLNSDNPVKDLGAFAKVNAEPVKATEFIDPRESTPPQAAAPERAFTDGGPLRPPAGWVFPPRAYLVRAVNAAGVESGPSAWVLTLPDSPKRIEARRRDDGSVVVRWEKDPNPDVVGYVVYRMDNWRNNMATRVNVVPTPATVLIDPDGRPTGERQRYWVVGVDRFGQEGPSGTGAWTFNR